MKLNEFYYDLPKELIAQKPLRQRDSSRLLVLDRQEKSIVEKNFSDMIEYLDPEDCLVLNDTRVIPVRLYGIRKTGGRVEVFLLNPGSKKLKALVRPSKRIKRNEVITLEGGISCTVLEEADVGRFVQFGAPEEDVLNSGHIPLPPYIDRSDTKNDAETYQTVYAAKRGATASPTAGLHFTKDLLNKIKDKGVETVYTTLHTSYGTFAPVKCENIEDHQMHSENYQLTQEAADRINKIKKSGGRIITVGTTSTRVLETVADSQGGLSASSGETNLFIYPGYKFKIVDAIITNFHLPESTLLMLVSAFAGRALIKEAYAEAIKREFRFFSYGDAMFIA